MYLAFNYKGLAFQENSYFLEHDHLITIVGSLGILANGLFRIMWGYLFDKFSFETLIRTINLVLLACCALVLLAVEYFASYLVLVIMSYLAYGGIYALMPTQCVRVMGQKVGTKVFWAVFSGFSISAVLQFCIQYFLVTNYGTKGYLYCVIIFLALEIVGLIMSFKIKFDYVES